MTATGILLGAVIFACGCLVGLCAAALFEWRHASDRRNIYRVMMRVAGATEIGTSDKTDDDIWAEEL